MRGSWSYVHWSVACCCWLHLYMYIVIYIYIYIYICLYFVLNMLFVYLEFVTKIISPWDY